jgi:hypothetical protein
LSVSTILNKILGNEDKQKEYFGDLNLTVYDDDFNGLIEILLELTCYFRMDIIEPLKNGQIKSQKNMIVKQVYQKYIQILQ